jgi:hypothetical protein
MKPVTPQTLHENATLVVYAEDQPQYCPFPVSRDPEGLLMTEWEPNEEERAVLAAGGRIRLWVNTFNQPLPPLRMEAVTVTTPAGSNPLVN